MKLLFDERAILGSQGRVRQGLSLTTAGSGKNALAYKQTRVDPQRYPPSGFASNRARRVVKSLAYPLPKITNSLTPLRAQQQRNAPNSTHRAHPFHTIYDASAKLIAEYSTIVETTNAKVGYLTNDHLGSPRINTDANGTVTARHDYHPFGEEIATSQRTSGLGYVDDSVRKQFTGYERDGETGLEYAQARMYAARLGRFMSVDKWSGSRTNPQTINRYSYVINNPLTLNDPTGNYPQWYGGSNVDDKKKEGWEDFVKDRRFPVLGKDEPYDPKKHQPRKEIPSRDTKPKIVELFNSEFERKYRVYLHIYDCHSWAFHNGKGHPGENKITDSLTPNVDSSPQTDLRSYNQLDPNEPNKKGDIVVYYVDNDSNGKWDEGENIVHSAKVTKVDDEGNTVRVSSKEGPGGRLMGHHPRDTGYNETKSGEQTTRAYFRKK